MNTRYFVLIIGLLGARKAEFLRRISLGERYLIDINNYRGTKRQRMRQFIADLNRCLENRLTVVINGDLLTKNHRLFYFSLARQHNMSVYSIDFGLGTLNEYQSYHSSPRIDRASIEKYYAECVNAFQKPELSEGFSRIIQCNDFS